ncbi:hypothetical protein GE21DRAFT_10133 [Neurospora crassa]|nr:hypothetical protein GE21DRAFT_10133 [Neurospora crassa]
MCTYKTHIRVCRRCSSEDTVLISEQLCSVAKNSGSGIFGSCLSGVSGQRDQTGYKCWQCQDEATLPASRSRSSSGSGSSTSSGSTGGGPRRRGSSVSVSVPIGPQGVNSMYGYNNNNNYHHGVGGGGGSGGVYDRGQQQRRISVSGQTTTTTTTLMMLQGQGREYVPGPAALPVSEQQQQGQQQDLERRLRRMGKMRADLGRYDGRFI